MINRSPSIQMMAIGCRAYAQMPGNTMARSWMLSVGSQVILWASLMLCCVGTTNRPCSVICAVRVKHHSSLISLLEQTWWGKFRKGRNQRSEWRLSCLPGCMAGVKYNPQALSIGLFDKPHWTALRSFKSPLPVVLSCCLSTQTSTGARSYLPLVRQPSIASWYDLQ